MDVEDTNVGPDKKESTIFYNKSNKKDESNEAVEYVSNKYKYKGTIEDFYSYCETNKYKIRYTNLLENNDVDSSNTSSCIIFSIDKDESTFIDKNMCDTNKTYIGFKEFKKFQKF